MEGAIFLFLMISAAVALISGYAEDAVQEPTPSLPSVANEGFAPLCGAAAIPMAALKTPVAPVAKGRGATNH